MTYAPAWQNLEVPVTDGHIAIAHLPASNKVSALAPIVVFHGNGMNGWCHRRLVEDYAGLHPIYLMDFRGHGQSSELEASDLKSWNVFYEDSEKVLSFIADRHEGLNSHLIAHSLGALVSIEMLNRGWNFNSMVLFEPVMLRTWEIWGVKFTQAFGKYFPKLKSLNPNVKVALKRRNGWKTREVVEASYLEKGFFRSFDPQVLADYLDRGLKETSQGVALACDPTLEAQIFHWVDLSIVSRTNRTCPDMKLILGETKGSTVSKRGLRDLNQRFPDAMVISMPDQGHFMPFNVPDRVKTFFQF